MATVLTIIGVDEMGISAPFLNILSPSMVKPFPAIHWFWNSIPYQRKPMNMPTTTEAAIASQLVFATNPSSTSLGWR